MNHSTTSKTWRFAAFQTAPASQQMETDFLTLSGSLAAQSAHPLASAVVRIAQSNRCPTCPVLGFQDFSEGFGGAVTLPGEQAPRAVLLGSYSLLAQAGLQTPELLEVAFRRWANEGAWVLLGGWDGYVRGVIKFVEQQGE